MKILFILLVLLITLNSIFCEVFGEELEIREDSYSNDILKRQAVNTACVCREFGINCNLSTVCTKDCRQELRAASELDCVFPFQYKGVWYDTCINVDRTEGIFWCSTDRIFNYKFAICEQECPLIARNLVKDDVDESHTSCRKAGNGWIGILPSVDSIKEILDLHNNERAIVNPTAADMKVLTWDNDLARLAMNLAMTGEFGHDCGNCRRVLSKKDIYNGQNLYASWGSTFKEVDTWKSAVTAWIQEKKDWIYDIGSKNGQVVGHYTQVVNSGARRIGCGAGNKKGSSEEIIVACNYATGQQSAKKPYVSGTPCTDCSECSTNLNACKCNKICRHGGTLNTKTCTCTCLAYATGPECESLLCDKTDDAYGCWNSQDPNLCNFSNTKPLCPHLCGSCSL
ncbi:unnamed protein product [Brachionus calyciflorus]|uniref:Fibronectin type-II domain-containing protein n=1 Tax=Brachionus calyciflorus TaxID=104777 RepID=A0A813VSJ2_9BILA|nr:unnamed protein product [Brachionus calyciflorus]